MKLTKSEVKVLALHTLDFIRSKYYTRIGCDKSETALIDEIIEDLTRIRDFYAEIERDEESEDGDNCI